MISVKQEDEIQRFHHDRFQFVILIRIGEEHVQEVRSVIVLRLGVNIGHSMGFAVGKGGNGTHLRNEARGLLVELFAVGQPHQSGIKATAGIDHCG